MPDTADYVENVFRLSDKKVRDCLVPVEKMMALELSTPPEKVLEAVRKGAHTRMPVYDGSIDNIVGIVNTKNLFFLFSLKGVVVLEDAMYPPLYLKPDESMANGPAAVPARARRPMALVRDDAGKILGLLTLGGRAGGDHRRHRGRARPADAEGEAGAASEAGAVGARDAGPCCQAARGPGSPVLTRQQKRTKMG